MHTPEPLIVQNVKMQTVETQIRQNANPKPVETAPKRPSAKLWNAGVPQGLNPIEVFCITQIKNWSGGNPRRFYYTILLYYLRKKMFPGMHSIDPTAKIRHLSSRKTRYCCRQLLLRFNRDEKKPFCLNLGICNVLLASQKHCTADLNNFLSKDSQ